MNIGEAIKVQRVTAFLRGEIDHCDPDARAALAAQLAELEAAAHKAVHAGRRGSLEDWDEHLTRITFEG